MDSDDVDPKLREFEKLIAEHNLWSSQVSEMSETALASISEQLNKLSVIIGNARHRSAAADEPRQSPDWLPPKAKVDEVFDKTNQKPSGAPRAAMAQLADVVDLLAAEDSLNLAAVAMIHARVRDVLAGGSDVRLTPTAILRRSADDPLSATQAPFAGALATFISEGAKDPASAEFTMAVVVRTCTLYAQLCEEANGVPRAK